MMPTWVRRMLPWPARADRRQAIATARRDRIAAERRAAHARDKAAQLRASVAENHIAEAIARQIRDSR